MRPLLIGTFFLAAMLIAFSPVSQASSDLYTMVKSVDPSESRIVLDYHWVFGIHERVEIRGDGLMRIERNVHTGDLFDRLNDDLSQKGDLSPYGWEIYSMEDGEYDKYWISQIDMGDFNSLIETLQASGFPDIEETYGDWEVWAISLKVGSEEARVGEVLRDFHPGFQSILEAIEEISEMVKLSDVVDEEEFAVFFEDSKSGSGGVS